MTKASTSKPSSAAPSESRAFHKWYQTPLPHCETTDTPRLTRPVDCKCDTYPDNMGPCLTFCSDGRNKKCPYCDHELVCHAKALWLAGFAAAERDTLSLAQLGKERQASGSDTRELREALRKYGRHAEDCNTLHGWSRLDQRQTCNCGFYAVLAQGEPQ